jgi:hypothetical protein
VSTPAGKRVFPVILVLLLLLYSGLELLYVTRLPLVMDEFQESSTLAQFETGLPYRDFAPYKTVLGHYVQLGAFAFGRDTWGKILSVKVAMALLNTAALGLAALFLSRRYSKVAVLCGLVLTILMSNFLERSSEFRTDMMTSWAGLASLLLLLNGRYAASGVAAGLSFLISQKGILYCVAGGAAMTALWLSGGAVERTARPLARFFLGASGALASYLGLWALLAGLERVLVTVFWTPRRMAIQSVYDIGLEMWAQTISRNPVFYGLAVLGMIRLIAAPADAPDRTRERTLAFYALALAILAALQRQPWPYFFVLIIPTAFVLIVALFHTHHRERGDWSPLGSSKLIMGLCIVFGILLPLSRIPVNLHRDNGHQRQALQLAEYVLAPDETYLAGVDMVYGRRQPVGMLRWIDYPRMQTLHRMSPAALAAIVDTLKRSRLKIAIDNYRLAGLPALLHDYITSETTSLWGNVRVYGPIVGSGDTAVVLKFSGRYEVQAPPRSTVTIDGRAVRAGGIVSLTGGPHRSASSHGFRLKLLPEGWELHVSETYRAPRDFFPNVYGY